MHRFFIPSSLPRSGEVELPRETARQISRVLRLRAEARVVLFSGDGTECEAVLTGVEARAVTVRVLEQRTPSVELPCALHVAVAALKGEKLDWTVQKLTELGASRISFLETERTVVAAGEERWSKRLERYERIAREAAEQCGRVRVPRIDGPVPLARLLSDERDRVRLFLDPLAGRSLLAEAAARPASVTLLIGPEGGFSPAECGAARESGAVPVALGRRILRAETAAVTAAALIAAAAEAEI